ncbi:hypothetical protein FQN49_000169 [Arthroderma sp. PD_2]|nr:hypothetical protein FQN49_000169 [Arthroderma sp. PD_2]
MANVRVTKLVLSGSWNADTQGYHYVDLHMRIHVNSGPDVTLPVLNLGPDMIVENLAQDVYRLKPELHPHHNPDPGPETGDQHLCDEGTEDEAPYSDEEGEVTYESLTSEDEETQTPRRLLTRSMTISPSPVKSRLFPPSPGICGEGEISDDEGSGSSDGEVWDTSHDDGVFEMSEDDAGQPEQHKDVETIQGQATFGSQPRNSPPDFGFGTPQDNIDMDTNIDDKENEVPKGEDECERVGSRVPLGELVPKRDPTAVLISSLRPENETPSTIDQGKPASPSPTPNDSLVILKRSSKSSPQKGSVSRIPIKKLHKGESSGSDCLPVNIISPQDDADSPQFMYKRNSPIARMAIMARELSNPIPSVANADNELGEQDAETQEIDETSIDQSSLQSVSEIRTPTKLQLPQSSSNNGLSVTGNSDDVAWPAEGSSGESEASKQADESQVSESMISFGQEHGSEATDDNIYQPLPPDYSEDLEPGNFDVNEFYDQSDEATSNDSESGGTCSDEEGSNEVALGVYEVDESIYLPSPSTASQRSMLWCYPKDLTDDERAGEHPTLEVVNDVLTVKMTSNVEPDNLLIVSQVRLTLTGALASDSEEFKATLPDNGANGSIRIPWKISYHPLTVDGWALKVCMMLPFSSKTQDGTSAAESPAGNEEQEQELSVQSTDAGRCPCCLYHLHNSPLVNKERLMAMADDVTQKLSIGSQVMKALLNDLLSYVDLSKPCGKALRNLGVMLSNLCGEEGPIPFISKCIKLGLLLGLMFFVSGIGLRAASRVLYWDEISVPSQPVIICPMPENVDASVCCGIDLSLCPGAAGRIGQPVDISGSEAASETSTATWAVHPVGCGEEGDCEASSTESGSSSTATAPIRAQPEVQQAGGDVPASGLDGAVDAADEGANIGSDEADKANDARRESIRDRVDWALGWRGPLFD